MIAFKGIPDKECWLCDNSYYIKKFWLLILLLNHNLLYQKCDFQTFGNTFIILISLFTNSCISCIISSIIIDGIINRIYYGCAKNVHLTANYSMIYFIWYILLCYVLTHYINLGTMKYVYIEHIRGAVFWYVTCI